MNEHFLDSGQVQSWLRAASLTGNTGAFTLEGIRETIDGVVADYDTPNKIGRVICWFTGFFDFEILAIEGGRQLYFRHEDKKQSMPPVLSAALAEFLAVLSAP